MFAHPQVWHDGDHAEQAGRWANKSESVWGDQSLTSLGGFQARHENATFPGDCRKLLGDLGNAPARGRHSSPQNQGGLKNWRWKAKSLPRWRWRSCSMGGRGSTSMEGRCLGWSLGGARPSSSPSTIQTQPRQDQLSLSICSWNKGAHAWVVSIEIVHAGDLSCKKEASTSGAEGASSCEDSRPAVEPECRQAACSWGTHSSWPRPGFDPRLSGYLDTKVTKYKQMNCLLLIWNFRHFLDRYSRLKLYPCCLAVHPYW